MIFFTMGEDHMHTFELRNTAHSACTSPQNT
jgi:hypothetical protein